MKFTGLAGARRLRAHGCSLAIVAMGVAGCAAPVAPRVESVGLAPRNSTLFLPEAASGALAAADAFDGPEFSRRDAQMNIASAQPVSTDDQWPVAERPTIEYYRSIRAGTSFTDAYLFFLPDQRRARIWGR